MPAELVSIDAPQLDRPRDPREQCHRAVTLLFAIESALVTAGLAERSPGLNGFTPVQQQVRDAMAIIERLQSQTERLRKKLENVLACDAFSDLEMRATVLDTVNRHRKTPLGDPLFYNPVEQELIACYRTMNQEDKNLVRVMLRRLGADLPDGAAR